MNYDILDIRKKVEIAMNNQNKHNDLNISGLNQVIKLSKKILNLIYIVMIFGVIFLITLLIKEWGILEFILTILRIATPFFIGFIIAWLFNPFVKYLESRGWRRGVASLTIYLVFIVLIFTFVSFLIPTIYNQLNDLIASLSSIYGSVREWITSILNNFNSNNMYDVAQIESNIFKAIEEFFSSVTNNLPSLFLTTIASLFSGIGTIAISLVVGIYLLFDFDNASYHLLKYIPSPYKEEINTLLTDIGTELRKCVKGTLLIAFAVFVLDSIGFAIAGLKAPLLFGVLCGITDLIPYIGPYIGGAAAVIVGYSQGPLIGTAVLIIATLVQLLENYVLQPVVMSKTMQLHPVTIIIGLLIFGHFFGIVGMILATPVMSLVKVVYRFFAKKYGWFNVDTE